jgi:hypothetical protein
VKEMMDNLSLSGRDNFLKLYLKPALDMGFIVQLYPESPNSPKQKYYLTEQGKLVLEKER